MSQDTTPGWLPDLLRAWGRIEEQIAALSARQDRADTQRERMEGQILDMRTDLAGMAATLSQQWSPGRSSTCAERKTMGEWAAYGISRAASLLWTRVGGAVILAGAIEHWVAPIGWLSDLLRWVAMLKGS